MGQDWLAISLYKYNVVLPGLSGRLSVLYPLEITNFERLETPFKASRKNDSL